MPMVKPPSRQVGTADQASRIKRTVDTLVSVLKVDRRETRFCHRLDGLGYRPSFGQFLSRHFAKYEQKDHQKG